MERRYGRNALKVIIIGDAGVGKTSLSQRYLTGKFTSQYRATIGADFLSKNITNQGNEYSLQVWDTAGQERFRAIGSAFYRGSDCCVIVYDITDSKSFDNVQMWKENFLKEGRVSPDFPFVIIGNKCDMEADRQVTSNQAEHWCRDNGGYNNFEVSAKDGNSIEEAFDVIIQNAVDQYTKLNLQNQAMLQGNQSGQKLTIPKKDGQKEKTVCC
jgi:Ras-related protein Rab-7A